jgi:glycosyltransferase involved in cell wall biosynthesis
MGNAKNLKNKISITLYHPPHASYGSIEEQLFFIAQGFDRIDNYEVNLVCASTREDDKLAGALTKGRVTRYPEFKNAPEEITYLYRCFKDKEADIVHVNELAFNAMIAANLAGIKRKILTYHTPTLNIKFNLKGQISRILAFKGNWDIVATTNSLADFIVRYKNIKRNKIRVVNYGLDRARFVATADRESMRKAFNIANDAFVIINIARLCKQKAQHLILESVRLLPRDILEKTIVLIVGGGEERDFLKGRIKELGLSGKALLPGHRSDVPDLLNMSDLFVLSSLFEGACISLMEAMAMGVPIVAPDIDGVKDTVTGGSTALLVPPGDAKKLAEGIASLSRDKGLMRAMGIAGKRRFNEYFIKERMIRDLDLFYRNGAE